MPLDRNADPASMAARIKDLEAQLAAQPPAPQTPVAAILAVGSSIMNLFPKWLIAAGLAVFLAFHAFSYYQQARQSAAETARIEAQSAVAQETAKGGLSGDILADEAILGQRPIVKKPAPIAPKP